MSLDDSGRSRGYFQSLTDTMPRNWDGDVNGTPERGSGIAPHTSFWVVTVRSSRRRRTKHVLAYGTGTFSASGWDCETSFVILFVRREDPSGHAWDAEEYRKWFDYQRGGMNVRTRPGDGIPHGSSGTGVPMLGPHSQESIEILGRAYRTRAIWGNRNSVPEPEDGSISPDFIKFRKVRKFREVGVPDVMCDWHSLRLGVSGSGRAGWGHVDVRWRMGIGWGGKGWGWKGEVDKLPDPAVGGRACIDIPDGDGSLVLT
ncbi:hypothetical protein B0H34DRAFT_679180 [Crassisporium funariophilum]|nr:hypothetical protein B0H34DRAFT_679180 [Crassisporium funariophilum]